MPRPFFSDRKAGPAGAFREPAEDLTVGLYALSLAAHVSAYGEDDDTRPG
jgi:hypothetical protein